MLKTIVIPCLFCMFGQASDDLQPLPDQAVNGAGSQASLLAEESAPEAIPKTPPQALDESPASYRPTPPELVAEALMLPPGHTLTGQPMNLASVLANLRDGGEQLAAISAYWQLTEAVGRYRFQLDYDRQLQQLRAGANESARMAAARAASKAALSEAELRAVAAQHEMAAYAGISTQSGLPLPADRPHVGQYITRFRELFAVRPAPAAARRLDRTLPIRFQSLEAQVQAIAAAEDACEALRASSNPLSEQIAALDLVRRLQCEWIAAVCRYNCDIAEYAVTVVPAGTNGSELVNLLIRPAPESVQPLVSEEPAAVQPAGATEPIPARAPQRQPSAPAELPNFRGAPIPIAPPSTGQPTPAKRPEKSPANQTTDQPGTEQDSNNLLPQRPVVPIDHETSDEATKATGSWASADEPAWPRRPASDGGPLLDGGLSTSSPPGHVVRRPLAVLSPLYPGLADASAGAQAKQLTITLHWDRNLPEASEPLELLECLQFRTGERRDLITAYWAARQQAAAYQVWQQHRQWLDDLSPSVAESSAAARIRAARSVAEASAISTQADLVEAQFYLAEAVGRTADVAWPIPATRPHSGSYLLHAESLPADFSGSASLWRLIDTVPRLSAHVRDRAAAIVEADAARGEAELAWQQGDVAFDEVLGSLDRQTRQTLGFLAVLTTYNNAIADYALRVLPADTPDEQLVKTLVMAE